MESNRVISKLRIYQWIFSREIPLKIAQICRRSSDAELRPSSPSSCRRSIASWLGKKLHHGDIENGLIELVFCLKVTHTHIYIYRPMMDNYRNFWNPHCSMQIYLEMALLSMYSTKNSCVYCWYMGKHSPGSICWTHSCPCLHGSSQIPCKQLDFWVG